MFDPSGVFAVIDLYGQCAQVSITSGSGVYPFVDNNLPQSDQAIMSPSSSGKTWHLTGQTENL